MLCRLREARANCVVKFLEHHVFSVYGVPQLIICDNGQQFAGKIFQKLIDSYQVQKIGLVLDMLLNIILKKEMRKWEFNIKDWRPHFGSNYNVWFGE